MNILEFISSIIKSLVWPALIFFIIYRFSDPLKEMILNISRLKFKDLDVTFSKALDKIEEKAEDAGLIIEQYSERKILQRTPEQLINEAAELSSNYPEASILLAWQSVELSMSNLMDKIPHIESNIAPSNSYNMMKNLVSKQIIDGNTFDMLNDMRMLRNKTSHVASESIAPSSAQKYVSLAKAIINKFDSYQA